MRSIVSILFVIIVGVVIAPTELIAQQFEDPTYYTVGPHYAEPGQIAAADMNNDGKLDLVICDQGRGGIALLLGNGDGTFQPAQHFATEDTHAFVVSDFNHDGIPDIAIIGTNGGALGIYTGNGDGTFRLTQDFYAYKDGENLLAADFDGDGNIDLAVAFLDRSHNGPIQGGVAIFFGHGDGTFTRPDTTTPAGLRPWALAAGDLNGDGHIDLVVADANDDERNTYTLHVLINNGDGTFAQGVRYQAGSEPLDVKISDLNHDGKLDLVVASAFNESVGVMLGKGDGTFQNPYIYQISGSPVDSVVIADFNSDGNLDIGYSSSAGNPGFLYGNGDGTFQSPITLIENDGGGQVTVGDLNDDGAPDLAYSLYYADQAAIFLNTGNSAHPAH